VPICLGILAVITALNLCGLGDSVRAFLLPTMVFIIGLLAIIAIGLIHPLARVDAANEWPGRRWLDLA
jgi:amino acid transporter